MISVVIPLYNKESSIVKTIESVLLQVYVDFEIVVVNDGSTDNSVALVHSLSDKRIRVIDQKNGGVSSARNNGVKTAKGDWIFFLDADDIISVDCLSTLHYLTIKYSTISVFTANFKIIFENNKEIMFCKGKNEVLINNPLKALWNRKIFPRTGAMLIKKECFNNIGYFRTDITIFEDLEFNIRLLKRYKIVYSPVDVLLYMCENSTLSNSIVSLSKEFAYHIEFDQATLYERFLLAENIYNTYVKRKKINDLDSKKYLIKKHRKRFLFIIFAHMYRRLINLWYKF